MSKQTARKARTTGPGPTTMTIEEWRAEGLRRFGPDQMKWRFKCPSCEHVASAEDYKAAGAPENAVAFSCVGRWLPKSTATIFEKGKGPCNYAGGGLFRLNPITVIEADGKEHTIFEFAEIEPTSVTDEARRLRELAGYVSRARMVLIDDGFSRDAVSAADVQLIVDALKARATSVTDGSGPNTENARA